MHLPSMANHASNKCNSRVSIKSRNSRDSVKQQLVGVDSTGQYSTQNKRRDNHININSTRPPSSSSRSNIESREIRISKKYSVLL